MPEPIFNLSDKVRFTGEQPPDSQPRLNRFEVYTVRDVLIVAGQSIYIRLAGVNCRNDELWEHLFFDARYFTLAVAPVEQDDGPGVRLWPIVEDEEDSALEPTVHALDLPCTQLAVVAEAVYQV